MCNFIGIRVTPSYIYYSICTKENEEITNIGVDKVIVPKALNLIEKLCYIRTTFFSIFNEYNIKNATIRQIEPSAMGNDAKAIISRVNLEGVLLELLGNSSIEKYCIGAMSTMSSNLNLSSKDLKAIFDGNNYFGIPEWEKKQKEEREAIICAIISTSLGGTENGESKSLLS